MVYVCRCTLIYIVHLHVFPARHESGSSHQSMLVKSGCSFKSGGSTDKPSNSTVRDFEDQSYVDRGSMLEDNDSVFREHSISDIDSIQPSTPRVGTKVSLGRSFGESKLTFDDLRQESVPTMLGAGESGFERLSGFDVNEEEEGEEKREEVGFVETAPTLGEEDVLQQSQSTLGGSRYSFG